MRTGHTYTHKHTHRFNLSEMKRKTTKLTEPTTALNTVTSTVYYYESTTIKLFSQPTTGEFEITCLRLYINIV